MPMTGVISGVITPKDNTKSNPLARLKVSIFSKPVLSFLSLSSLKEFKIILMNNLHSQWIRFSITLNAVVPIQVLGKFLSMHI